MCGNHRKFANTQNKKVSYTISIVERSKQEAQLSQKGRTMLCVIEYSAKSLKVT